jgi:transporter family protein
MNAEMASLYVLLTWLTWLCFPLYSPQLPAILAKLGVRSVDSNLATAIPTSVVVVFTWLFAYTTWQSSALAAISAKT